MEVLPPESAKGASKLWDVKGFTAAQKAAEEEKARRAALIAKAAKPPTVVLPPRSEKMFIEAVAKVHNGAISAWAASLSASDVGGRSLADFFSERFPTWEQKASKAKKQAIDAAPALPPPVLYEGGWLEQCISAGGEEPLTDLKFTYLVRENAKQLNRARLMQRILNKSDEEKDTLLAHFKKVVKVRRALDDLTAVPAEQKEQLERSAVQRLEEQQPQADFSALMKQKPLQEHFAQRFPQGLPSRAKAAEAARRSCTIILKAAASSASLRGAEAEWVARRRAAIAIQSAWRCALARECTGILRRCRVAKRAAETLQFHWRCALGRAAARRAREEARAARIASAEMFASLSRAREAAKKAKRAAAEAALQSERERSQGR